MRVSDFQYIEDIHFYRKVEGHGKFLILSRSYSVAFWLDGELVRYQVPAEFESDGPSVPYLIPKWIAQTGLSFSLEAAVVHDHMCVVKSTWGSKVAAEIFYAGMLAAIPEPHTRKERLRAKAAKVRAWGMWKAVRFGGPQWASWKGVK